MAGWQSACGSALIFVAVPFFVVGVRLQERANHGISINYSSMMIALRERVRLLSSVLSVPGMVVVVHLMPNNKFF
jgi:hypothetical protein